MGGWIGWIDWMGGWGLCDDDEEGDDVCIQIYANCYDGME